MRVNSLLLGAKLRLGFDARPKVGKRSGPLGVNYGRLQIVRWWVAIKVAAIAHSADF